MLYCRVLHRVVLSCLALCRAMPHCIATSKRLTRLHRIGVVLYCLGFCVALCCADLRSIDAGARSGQTNFNIHRWHCIVRGRGALHYITYCIALCRIVSCCVLSCCAVLCAIASCFVVLCCFVVCVFVAVMSHWYKGGIVIYNCDCHVFRCIVHCCVVPCCCALRGAAQRRSLV